MTRPFLFALAVMAATAGSPERMLRLAAGPQLSLRAGAQFKPLHTVKVSPGTPFLIAAPGETLDLPLRVEIAGGFHINAAKPTFDYMIPTRLEWTSKEFKLLKVEYPAGERRAFAFSPDKPLEVYQGAVSIRTRFQVPRGTAPGKVNLTGKLKYQACDDKACYPPASAPVEVAVQVVRKPAK